MTRRISIILLFAFALTLLRPDPVSACSTDPTVGSAYFQYPIPGSGATAPRNTRIWVPPYDYPRDLGETDIVVKADNVAVATTGVPIAIAGERDTIVWMLTPTMPLSPGSSITVTVLGDVLAQFTVSDAEDVTAPARPLSTRVHVEGAYWGGFSCPEPSSVLVTADDGDDLLFVTKAPAADVPMTALAIGSGSRAAATDLAEGEHSLHVIAVDLAGNASTAPLPVFTVPAEQSGCSAGGTPSMVWMLVVVAAIALRRRRPA